jgi:transcriptional regulator with PAS, ATPase and Fis domain
MVVRAIHRLSRRKEQPLLACDCSALAPTLLESELFGHVKGSFSGAIATKQGLFEAAQKGTLFLDEAANLSMETQGKLLRVLETKCVKKVGDTAEREVDIRLIASTWSPSGCHRSASGRAISRSWWPPFWSGSAKSST